MCTARLLSAAPDVALGGAFLLTWTASRWIGLDLLRYAMLAMLLEFIVIHSAARAHRGSPRCIHGCPRLNKVAQSSERRAAAHGTGGSGTRPTCE